MCEKSGGLHHQGPMMLLPKGKRQNKGDAAYWENRKGGESDLENYCCRETNLESSCLSSTYPDAGPLKNIRESCEKFSEQ